MDDAIEKGHEREPRWDYLLGHRETTKIVGLEPHSAETSEISTVIRKRKHAREQLAEHFRPGVEVAEWFWVASGRVSFLAHEKATLSLAQNGITFVGTKLLAKHLAPLEARKKK
ncbi:hypothetical protein [Pendulispora albinea]|uniref:Cyclic nucleotide-binding domain-containing protein n=1 Tax=Pendulispora albinea TaxID=2741071 RepID=A0ABZ2M9D0_9BACT